MGRGKTGGRETGRTCCCPQDEGRWLANIVMTGAVILVSSTCSMLIVTTTHTS